MSALMSCERSSEPGGAPIAISNRSASQTRSTSPNSLSADDPSPSVPKNAVVAHLLAEVLGVAEKALGEIDAWDRRIGVDPANEIDVTAEDARLHVVGADHVIRHEQELLAGDPVVVLGDDRGEFRDAACRRIALEDQVQHGHEVALTATEAAVQIARLARLRLQGALDEAQGIFVAGLQLWGDHILAEGLLGTGDTLREPEHELPLLDVVGDLNQVFEIRVILSSPIIRRSSGLKALGLSICASPAATSGCAAAAARL